ncbi:hypothetical protein [Spirosoma pollinicola]|uniref:Uncharacterized protein n=1 Tax=Spirosoma pollinicola TaxID=2057025 RepID=A0A2K8ZAE8_9BACT|nr:hypothetical protein [Spirosoma pollinicola]AUD06852.1 hypothetical protein CWM47_36380 [Spirosoma pollinicola]
MDKAMDQNQSLPINRTQPAAILTRRLALTRSVEQAAEAFNRAWQKQQTNLNRVPVLQDRLDQLQAKLDELKIEAP